MYESEERKYQATVRGKKMEDGNSYEMSGLSIRAGTCFLKFLSHKKTPNEVTLNAISVPFQIAESSSSATLTPTPTPSPPTLDPKNIASLQMMREIIQDFLLIVQQLQKKILFLKKEFLHLVK